MKIVATVACLAAVLVAAGCGSSAKTATTPVTTLAGVGVVTKGGPPQPSTPSACVRRWNGHANSRGRATAKQRAPQANTALVGAAKPTGYFSDLAGRCLVYLVTAPRRAAVFVETARGRFTFTAHASGSFLTNAVLESSGRLQLR